MLSEILIRHIFKMFKTSSYTYYFQVFDDVMKTHQESDYNNVSEWEEYSVFYMMYATYQWGIFGCDMIVKTKTAKELLEMIKTVKFDVIVQDITLPQCLCGLWEVKIKAIYNQ